MPRDASAPRVVPLTKRDTDYLEVEVEGRARGTPQTTRDVLTFLVDTASPISFIVPAFHDQFDRLIVSKSAELHKRLTLIGDITYFNVEDIDLIFPCADGGELPIETDSLAFVTQVCATAPGSSALGPADVPINILGMDILKRFALALDPGPAGEAYLIHNAHVHVSKTLRQDPKFSGAFGTALHPIVTIGKDQIEVGEPACAVRSANQEVLPANAPQWVLNDLTNHPLPNSDKKGHKERQPLRRPCRRVCRVSIDDHTVRTRDVSPKFIGFDCDRWIPISTQIKILPEGMPESEALLARTTKIGKTASGAAFRVCAEMLGKAPPVQCDA